MVENRLYIQGVQGILHQQVMVMQQPSIFRGPNSQKGAGIAVRRKATAAERIQSQLDNNPYQNGFSSAPSAYI